MDFIELNTIFIHTDMMGVHFTTTLLTQYVAIGVVFMWFLVY
jgi:hypothetical protein